jgi:myo-inositol-1(or 4)-monophosphatase
LKTGKQTRTLLHLPTLETLAAVLSDAAGIARKSVEDRTSHQVLDTKANDSPVTQTDLAIAAFLKNRLLALVPDAGWLCEEGDTAPSDARQVWIVDPLDGTKEFIRGLPEFSISVALIREREPVLGAVINPLTGEAGYWSQAEGLHFRSAPSRSDRQPSRPLSQAVANASRTEFEKNRLGGFTPFLKQIVPLGSVAYKLLRVAAGSEDLYFSVEPKSEWDLCGGVALVRAAGLEYQRFDRELTTFGGANTRISSGAVAGQPGMVAEFFRLCEAEITKYQAMIRSGEIR